MTDYPTGISERVASSGVPDYFRKVFHDLAFITLCFREALDEIGEEELSQALPTPWDERDQAQYRLSPGLTQAYTIWFQLLNMVEENAIAQYRRSLQAQQRLAEDPGTWEDQFARLKAFGVTGEAIAAALPGIHVEPVLTAHPTEAKRQTVLEHHRELYLLLLQRENTMYTPAEQEATRHEIKALLERLWRTGEIFLEKPDVASELGNVIHYLRNALPDVLPLVDRRLREAWHDAGFAAALLDDPDLRPRLSFGNWVGGDRDGHPFVTAEVTRLTLQRLRLNALQLVHGRLVRLATQVSLSDRLQDPPRELLDRIADMVRLLGDRAEHARRRNPGEPWRQLVNLMIARLPVESAGLEGVRPVEGAHCYRRAEDLADDLTTLSEALGRGGARRLADVTVRPVIDLVKTFGFHLAKLDIRQNSRFHDLAVVQLLAKAGLDGADFMQWPEARRVEFLQQELASLRPFARAEPGIGAEADAVLSCYRVVREHLDAHGHDGLGSLIISMTRGLSDLLVVYVLAREAGLLIESDDGPVCLMPIVPLFETVEDLKRAPDVLQSFLQLPLTRRSLQLQVPAGATPVQQVMVGYSDSNKDGGIFASLWHLHRAQERIVRVGETAGVRIRFFHGRGGTVSRGAGPTHRFLSALPCGSLEGDLRLTEQGEVIAQKYANKITAAHTLELLLAGTTAVTLQHRAPGRQDLGLGPVMDHLAEESRRAYQTLLGSDGFLSFWSQATPIDAIEAARLGSRPVRRTGRRTLADLRAIPWVFSWSQSRFFLSGWYGFGQALEDLKADDPATFEALRANAFEWPPLRYIISSVASSIAAADLEIMGLYAELVEDREVRERFMSFIAAEFERTQGMLEIVFGGPLAERRPRIHAMLSLRRGALRPLHRQQVDALRRWRALRGTGDQRLVEDLEAQLLLTLGAIASGLGATG